MQKSQLLLDKLSELENYFGDREVADNTVSKASIGWHLDHSLKVINYVANLLKSSNPEDYTWQFNYLRSYCFLLNRFPRGKARAPKKVLPEMEITLDALEKQLQEAKFAIDSITPLDPKANVKHHIFGYLNKKQTLKFLNLHTEHHLKIIRDIMKKP